MKIIKNILTKCIFAFTLLYGFNMIMESLKLFIPMNIFTLGIVGLLGFPGLFILVGLSII